MNQEKTNKFQKTLGDERERRFLIKQYLPIRTLMSSVFTPEVEISDMRDSPVSKPVFNQIRWHWTVNLFSTNFENEISHFNPLFFWTNMEQNFSRRFFYARPIYAATIPVIWPSLVWTYFFNPTKIWFHSAQLDYHYSTQTDSPPTNFFFYQYLIFLKRRIYSNLFIVFKRHSGYISGLKMVYLSC